MGAVETEEADVVDDRDEVDETDDAACEPVRGPWLDADRRCCRDGRPPREVARERAVCVGEGDDEDVERSRILRGLVSEPPWWYRAPVDGARGWGRRKVAAEGVARAVGWSIDWTGGCCCCCRREGSPPPPPPPPAWGG